jgi:hypothetical protein
MDAMEQFIWKAVCEVLVEPGDLPSGSTKGFVSVTTWADSVETVKEKVAGYLASHQWRLLAIEDAKPIDERQDYGEESADMIARTRANPRAIILGRFFSYKES